VWADHRRGLGRCGLVPEKINKNGLKPWVKSGPGVWGDDSGLELLQRSAQMHYSNQLTCSLAVLTGSQRTDPRVEPAGSACVDHVVRCGVGAKFILCGVVWVQGINLVVWCGLVN
jgi:hypothetical protein